MSTSSGSTGGVGTHLRPLALSLAERTAWVPLVIGLGGAALVSEAGKRLWETIPYSRPWEKVGRKPTLTKYTTVLTSGVTVRARPAGKLWGIDVWREHADS